MNESRPPNEPGNVPEERPEQPAEASAGTERGAASPAESAADTDRSTDPEAATGDESEREEGDRSAAQADSGNGGDGGGEDAGPEARTSGGGGPRLPTVLACVAVIVAFAAGGFAGYLAYRLEAVEERLAAIPEDRDEDIAAAIAEVDVRDDLAALENGLRAETRAREALAERQQEAMAELRAAFDDVRELAVGHHTRWRLAEVRYLVGIGVQRLQLAADPDGAAAALEAADEALHRLGDSRLLPLREAIVEDIARIRELEPPDVEGIALRLLRLERSVDGLPLARPEAADDEAPATNGEESLWQRMLAELRGMIVVRHRDSGPVAGLAGDAGSLPPREALSLLLRQARAAALNGDAGSYERAMASARDLVGERFDTASAVVERFADRLGELAQRPVRMPVPDLGTTMDRVAELTARLEAERERAHEESGTGTAEPDE